MKKMAQLWCMALLLGMSSSSLAEPAGGEAMCLEPEPSADKYQTLRSLSLTIRGVPPTLDEFEDLHAFESVPDAWIDEWLNSVAFSEQVSRFHRGLLWNRVDNRSPYLSWTITGAAPFTGYSMQVVYRGKHVGCLDEPATFDENGEIVGFWNEHLQAIQEGYVMVAPYWDPENPIKVCAYNAQDNMISPSGTICGTKAAQSDPKCGCGPNLIWCSTSKVEDVVLRSMGLAVEKTIEHIILEDRPYTDLFFNNTTYVNGPLVHMWRYFAHRSSHLDRGQTFIPYSLDPDLLPDLDYTEVDTWVPVELPAFHAGVFTSPAYLLRFTVNRRRARQFYESFLCSPFVPPASGLEIDEESANEPDFQVRPGCLYCHKSLEPAAAYWGRWTSRGAGYLNPVDFPPYREECDYCAVYGDCPFECSRHYITHALSAKEKDYYGWLEAYQFRLDEHYPNVEIGPKLLFEKKFVDGSIARCSTQNAIRWLIRRDLEPYEMDWIDNLAQEFAANGYDYKALVKSILTHPHFRRVL